MLYIAWVAFYTRRAVANCQMRAHTFLKSETTVISSCHNPLPLDNSTSHHVVVCCYQGRWIPILLYPLKDAIALRQKALSFGKDLLVCPISSFSTQELELL